MRIHLTSNSVRATALVNQGLYALDIPSMVDKAWVSCGTTMKPPDSVHNYFEQAQFIFCGSDRARSTARHYEALKNYWNKVIWYDFTDSCEVDQFPFFKAVAYFKRSITTPQRAYIQMRYNQHIIHPIDYAALDEFYYAKPTDRDIPIGCFFDKKHDLGKRRQNLVEELEPYTYVSATHPTGTEGRASIEASPPNCFFDYIHMLHRSKIVFTAFPEQHDGDSRTWEAFASGALVFRDRTWITKDLVDGTHFFEYDATDRDLIRFSIDLARHMLKDDVRREEIAKAGYEYVKTNHRPINRVKHMMHIASSKGMYHI